MNGKEWVAALKGIKFRALFASLYGEGAVEQQRVRYVKLVEGLLNNGIFPAERFPETAGPVRIFTAPGRTELGGNHTDHNCGKALAASVQLDAAAVAAPREDNRIVFRSAGFPDVSIDITDTGVRQEEKGATEALLRGVAAGFVQRGIFVKGWTANAGSTVFPGSGLSSSAALEVLAGKIFDGLYGGGTLPAIELAKIAQNAENLYYGKPSGLMDQAASASGGAVAIDFAKPHPEIIRMEFDPERAGYALCVVNTGGNHADLTADYGAVPAEMRRVAAFFGARDLREAGRDALTNALADHRRARQIRERCGDRAVLRALHFFDENDRVDEMHKILERFNALHEGNKKEINETFSRFLQTVNESGASSWELLQNIYPPGNPKEQGIALALAITRYFTAGVGKRRIACRVHGGGFAGTIQAYIPQACLDEYRQTMEAAFGSGAVTALKIRSLGAAEIVMDS